jgi:predicted unusual protein kinase regulating ubiquinone biosynthesis (AarF/ABC1/UbiB family)
MMGRIPGDVRGGLMELFYGVYNKDADRCLEALVTMGVLVSCTCFPACFREHSDGSLGTFAATTA